MGALVHRDDLVRAQLAEPRGVARDSLPVRVGITGSGSDLLVLAWSAADLARERAAGARLLGRLGVRPGMRVANTLPGALATPGSLLLGDVVEELGGLDVPLGDLDSEAAARAAWELIDRVTPNVLVLDPPSATQLLAAAPPGARPWWQGIVWLRGGRPGTAGAAGFTGWQRTWLAVPEVTCFAAGSCAAGRFHLDDGVHAEIVDGRLVLGRDATTWRYATDLRAQLAVPPCVCGEPGPTLEIP